MTDSSNKETVEVPVQLLKAALNILSDSVHWQPEVEEQLKKLIPKPARYVLVRDYENGTGRVIGKEWLAEQPNALKAIDSAVDTIVFETNFSAHTKRQDIKARIHAALGVDE